MFSSRFVSGRVPRLCADRQPGRLHPLGVGLLAAAMALGLPGLSQAWQDNPAQGQTWDTAERDRGDVSVNARVLDMGGHLQLIRANGEVIDSVQAHRLRHTLLEEGDRLNSRWNSRMELAIGSSRLRLDENTEVVLLRLERDRLEVQVDRGHVVLVVPRDDVARRWRVSSALGVHLPHGAGLFRIDAPGPRRFNDNASATAWRSPMHIESQDGTLLLPAGRRVELDRDGRWIMGTPQADGFAQWAMVSPEELNYRPPEPPVRYYEEARPPERVYERPYERPYERSYERPPERWEPRHPSPRVIVTPPPVMVAPPVIITPPVQVPVPTPAPQPRPRPPQQPQPQPTLPATPVQPVQPAMPIRPPQPAQPVQPVQPPQPSQPEQQPRWGSRWNSPTPQPPAQAASQPRRPDRQIQEQEGQPAGQQRSSRAL